MPSYIQEVDEDGNTAAEAAAIVARQARMALAKQLKGTHATISLFSLPQFNSSDLVSSHLTSPPLMNSIHADEKDAKDGKSGAKKDKPVEKSLVVLEVKPWEADTNLEEVRTFS